MDFFHLGKSAQEFNFISVFLDAPWFQLLRSFFFGGGREWSLTISMKHQDWYYWTRNIFSKMFTLFTKQKRMKSFRIRQGEVSHLFLWLWISKEERRSGREGQGKEKVRKNRRKTGKEAKKKEGKGVSKKGGTKERWKKRRKGESYL